MSKASYMTFRRGIYTMTAIAAGFALARSRKQQIREGLENAFGWMDERWYWFYQGMLCRLGEDPTKADQMYARSPRQEICTFTACPWQSMGANRTA